MPTEKEKGTIASFCVAVEGSDLDTIEKLIKMNENLKVEMLTANKCKAFIDAAKSTNPGVIAQLITWVGDDTDLKAKLLKAQGFSAFRLAAVNSELDVIEQLITWVDDNTELKKGMLEAKDCEAFRNAVRATAFGHHELIEKLMAWVGDDANVEWRQKLLTARGNFALYHAVVDENFNVDDRLKVITKLVEWMAPVDTSNSENEVLNGKLNDLRREVIKTPGFLIFRKATEIGNIDVIKQLMDCIDYDESLKKELTRDPFFFSLLEAFCKAAENGQSEVIEILFNWIDDQVKNRLLNVGYCNALNKAAVGNHENVVKQLLKYVQSDNNLTEVSASILTNTRFSHLLEENAKEPAKGSDDIVSSTSVKRVKRRTKRSTVDPAAAVVASQPAKKSGGSVKSPSAKLKRGK